MGTNYYVKENVCPHCHRSSSDIHLGKSSGGWKFTFQYNEGYYYKNIKELKQWLKGKEIWDEYDRKITHKEFWDMVKSKQTNTTDECDISIDGYSFNNCDFS